VWSRRTYRVEDVIDGDADRQDGRRAVAAHGAGRSVVPVTCEQPLLDAMLVRLVAVDRQPTWRTPLVVVPAVDRRRLGPR